MRQGGCHGCHARSLDRCPRAVAGAGRSAARPCRSGTAARDRGEGEALDHQKCQKQFRADWRTLNHDTWVHALDYYEARRNAEQVIYDQLRWLLSDPEAQELIPGHEAAAAKVLAKVKPIVASQRDEYFKELDAFAKKYSRKCLSDEGTTVFKAGMRALRASFKDIYSAHEQLFRANLAVQTAHADLAGQCLQDGRS